MFLDKKTVLNNTFGFILGENYHLSMNRAWFLFLFVTDQKQLSRIIFSIHFRVPIIKL